MAKEVSPLSVVDGPCDICIILDGDDSAKPVKWCNMCGKWRCEPCRNDLLRITRAVALQALDGLKRKP